MIALEVNQQAGQKIDRRSLQALLVEAERVLGLTGEHEVSLALVDDRAIRELNRIYRGRDAVTDVLSFGERDVREEKAQTSSGYLGEIIICYPQVRRQAKEHGQSVEAELHLLLVHGLLHLLGYDHMKKAEAERMEGLQARILTGKEG